MLDPGETFVFTNVGDTNQDGVQGPGETFQFYNAGDTDHNGVEDGGETFQFDWSTIRPPRSMPIMTGSMTATPIMTAF